MMKLRTRGKNFLVSWHFPRILPNKHGVGATELSAVRDCGIS